MFERWGEAFRKQVDPLWLLKFLPNMPASHIAIYNDLRGPFDSQSKREDANEASAAESLPTPTVRILRMSVSVSRVWYSTSRSRMYFT